MAKEKFILQFADKDINELEIALEERKLSLCNAVNIENIDDLIDEIEAIEFLIRDYELNG